MTNKEAIKTIKRIRFSKIEMRDCPEREALTLAIKALENERPKGKKDIRKPYGWQFCSECRKVIEPQDNFCWFCGADLRGDTE